MKTVQELRRLTVGAVLMDARKSAHLTQGFIAKELGYSQAQFVSNWERGLAMPPPSAVPKLVDLLGLDLDRYVSSVRSFRYAVADQEVDQIKAEVHGAAKGDSDVQNEV